MVSHRFEVADGVGGWFLDRAGFAAIVLPGRTIWITPAYWDHPGIRAHELAHIAQMDRDGWTFWPRCIWYVVRYGYSNSPYEIEARAAGDQAVSRELPF